MKHVNTHIGQRIKEIRKTKGLTQETLAEKVEISTRYLSRLEVGQQSASIDTLVRLAEALNVELGELFDFGHHGTVTELRQMLRKQIQESNEEQLRLAVKLFRAVLQ